MHKFVATFAVLLGLLAIPASASALKFTPATGSPIVASTPEWDPPEVITDGYSPSGIATADFNLDGRDDIAVAGDNSPDIYVYISQADGTFEPSGWNPVGSNSSVPGRTFIEAVDIDQDGYPDLIAGNYVSPTAVELYRNKMATQGNGLGEAFGTVPDQTVSLGPSDPGAAEYRSLSVGDKDGDGYPDLVLGLYDNSYVLIRNDEGTLEMPSGVIEVPRTDPLNFDGLTSTEMGDFDGDGEGDLAFIAKRSFASDDPDKLLLASSAGETTFDATPDLVATADDEFFAHLEKLDLNGDQYDDLVFQSRTPDYESRLWASLGSATGPTTPTVVGNPINIGPASVGDFDGDEIDDVAVSAFNLGFEVFHGNGAGGLTLDPRAPFETPAFGQTTFNPQTSAALDMNGDGYLDFAMGSGHAGDTGQMRGVHVMLNSRYSDIEVNPESVDFGQVKTDGELLAPVKIEVSSTGNVGLELEETVLTGPDRDRFNVSGGPCVNSIISPGESCEIAVSVNQTGPEGPANAELEIYSNVGTEPVRIPLTASFLPPEELPDPQPKLSLKVKSAKKVKAGKKLLVTATVRNSGDAASRAVTLKPSAPKKVAGKAKAMKIKSVAAGKSVVRKFRIPVKRSAKGRFKVTVTMTHAGKAKAGKTGAVKVTR